METGHKNPSGGAGGISAKRGRNEHLYLKGFKAFSFPVPWMVLSYRKVVFRF
jgi:hypothetical protein